MQTRPRLTFFPTRPARRISTKTFGFAVTGYEFRSPTEVSCDGETVDVSATHYGFEMLGDSNELDLLSIAPSMAVGGSMHMDTRVNKVANFKISRPSRSFVVI